VQVQYQSQPQSQYASQAALLQYQAQVHCQAQGVPEQSLLSAPKPLGPLPRVPLAPLHTVPPGQHQE